jgi:hypothetical protein
MNSRLYAWACVVLLLAAMVSLSGCGGDAEPQPLETQRPLPGGGQVKASSP